jgi:hypothetical protein
MGFRKHLLAYANCVASTSRGEKFAGGAGIGIDWLTKMAFLIVRGDFVQSEVRTCTCGE